MRQHSDDVVRRAVAEAEHNALQRVHCVTRLDHRRQVLAEFGTYHCALCCGPTCGRVGHCDFTQTLHRQQAGRGSKSLGRVLAPRKRSRAFPRVACASCDVRVFNVWRIVYSSPMKSPPPTRRCCVQSCAACLVTAATMCSARRHANSRHRRQHEHRPGFVQHCHVHMPPHHGW